MGPVPCRRRTLRPALDHDRARRQHSRAGRVAGGARSRSRDHRGGACVEVSGMSAPMSTLAELQRDFQRHVMHGHDRIVDAVEDTPPVPATARLAIYSEAYRLRLTEALASSLPRLQQLLGTDEFAKVAGEYIDLCPSSYPSIRWFGDRL